MLTQQIGFIGTGQMASALAGGFVRASLASAGQIVGHDADGEAGERFRQSLPGARLVGDNGAVVAAADVVFLAVKPQSVAAVCDDLKAADTDGKLFVSIVAGVPLEVLSRGLRTTRLVRVMPNTPCLVGLAAAGFCLGPGATPDDEKIVQRLLGAVGISYKLEEKLLDAVTGLSGSGPAFVYVLIEALADGGVQMGMPRPVAAALAAQTVRGAAEMVQATGEHPAVLRDRVASPGGTTVAGLAALEQGGFRATIMSAVAAATRRSIELGKTGQQESDKR